MNPLAERLKEYLQHELASGRGSTRNFYLLMANDEDVFVSEIPIHGREPDMGAAHALAEMMKRGDAAFKMTEDTYGCLVFLDEEFACFVEADGVMKYIVTGNRITEELDMTHDAFEKVMPTLLKELLNIIRRGQEL